MQLPKESENQILVIHGFKPKGYFSIRIMVLEKIFWFETKQRLWEWKGVIFYVIKD